MLAILLRPLHLLLHLILLKSNEISTVIILREVKITSPM